MEYLVTIPNHDELQGTYHPLDPAVFGALYEDDVGAVIYVYKVVHVAEPTHETLELHLDLDGCFDREGYEAWLCDREKVAAWRDKKTAEVAGAKTEDVIAQLGLGDMAVALSNSEKVELYKSAFLKVPGVQEKVDKLMEAAPLGFDEEGNAIDPPHYQDYLETHDKQYQWIEAMSGVMKTERMEGALELMTRKYIDRRGGKDAGIQELKKSLWYLKYWIAYLQNGCEMTLVADVENLLK